MTWHHGIEEWSSQVRGWDANNNRRTERSTIAQLDGTVVTHWHRLQANSPVPPMTLDGSVAYRVPQGRWECLSMSQLALPTSPALLRQGPVLLLRNLTGHSLVKFEGAYRMGLLVV